MSPKEGAAFLAQNFSKTEQLAELKAMFAVGGRTGNLAHGIAIELRLIEHEELAEPVKESLKIRAPDASVGYGEGARHDAGKRSEFAGKGPMFARMSGGKTDDEKKSDDEG